MPQGAVHGLAANQPSSIFDGAFDHEPIEPKPVSRGVAQSSIKALLSFIDTLKKHINANPRLLVETILYSVCALEGFFPMPAAAGILLMSSNISLLPLCFCFASCTVSRETTTLMSVWLTRFSAKTKRAMITPSYSPFYCR